jgi:integrase
MAVYKEPGTNTWRVIYRYTDWTGERRQSSKRGFATKRDAQAWEREQLQKTQSDMDMTFAAFVELYSQDMKTRLRQNTWQTKEYIIQKKLLPYFGSKKMNGISAKDVIQWQNEMMNYHDKDGKPFAATYLKTLHNQVSAIFNHAVRFYDLKGNPAAKAGSIGKKEAKEMLFWTKDEYMKFADAMMDKPLSFYAFEMLYWCGIRQGELLALTPADFDFDKETVSINKSYQRIGREDVITDPKTPKSNRIIKMPGFLCQEIQEYKKSLYGCNSDERLFPITKSYLHHEMNRGSKASDVKRIRVHDLRHSHVSHLIEMGFSVVAIADRVGHESIDITYRYAHLFPSKQIEIADKLDIERGEDF